MVGTRADDPDLHAVLRIPPGEAVEAIEAFARVQVIERPLPVDRKGLCVARNVDRTPPDVSLGVRVPDDALVLRRAAGLHARIGDERAVFGNARIALVPDGMF